MLLFVSLGRRERLGRELEWLSECPFVECDKGGLLLEVKSFGLDKEVWLVIILALVHGRPPVGRGEESRLNYGPPSAQVLRSSRNVVRHENCWEALTHSGLAAQRPQPSSSRSISPGRS